MGLEGGELAGAVVGGLVGGTLLLILLLWLIRIWMQGAKVTSRAMLKGKVVVITGANTGIGKETALDLSRRGAKIVMLVRDQEKGNVAANQIQKITEGDVVVHKCDLADLDSVRGCAEQLENSVEKIDILINNAGVMACPEMRTKQGFEMQFGTNHLGHFLLTNLLLPLIKKAAPGARIINVSSLAHTAGEMQWDDLNFEKTTYSPIKAYSQSKLANILFTKELARKGEGSGVTSYALHPGCIKTELTRHIKDTYGSCLSFLVGMFNFMIRTPESGAQTTIFCAVEESISEHSGRYYSDCREVRPAEQADRVEEAARLWDISEELTGLKDK